MPELPSLDLVLDTLADEPDGLVRDLSPTDSMDDGDIESYFGSGRSALRNVRLALALAGRSDAQRILDLPCGHGRVLRYLRAGFPNAEICACDLDQDGVAFCAETFGAVPTVSNEDPSRLELPGTFDLIWCGSLFTHLRAEGWLPFFRALDQVLEPGGLLVFTVHGRMSATYLEGGFTFGMDEATARETLAALETEDFVYWPYPKKIAELAAPEGDYGVSFSKPAWVVRELTSQPHLRLLSYTEAGWFRHQDVVVAHKPPADWTERSPADSDPRQI